MEADEKKCPQCAETVKAEAKICRFCGHSFERESSAAPTGSKSPEKGGGAVGKGCLIVIGIVVVLLIIGSLSGPAESDLQMADSSMDAASGDAVEAAGAEAMENQASSSLTGPQANARRSAEQYLAMSGFSRQGLIEQLSSDAGNGYDVADATAAVDSLSVDWNEQAARSAEQYLGMMGFSCSGLIEQLSSSAGSGYTQSQARFGAEQAGAC